MSSTAREFRAGTAANGGEAAPLVESAMLLRWRAPELALLLADRAVAAAQDDTMAALRADHVAVFALNRLSRYGEAALRLLPAIQDADTPPGMRHELYIELAQCAAALGLPTIALGAVRAVLAAGDDVAPALRGRALVAVAEAAVPLGRDELVSSALEEAEELYREDPSLDHDTALVLRAAIRATDAARHRARGRGDEAEAKAREGRELLTGLADPDHDCGEVSARLMLELALTLLARGAGEIATQEVRPVLRRQVRAAAAGAVGRLRLALATQVHLAAGRHEPALTLLADAVEGAQRFGVDAVLAECLEGLSHVHEARDEFADALHCMRAARAAEGRHRGEMEAARSILVENFGSARREEARLVGQVAELLANASASGAGLDADTGSVHGEAMADSPADSPAAVAPENATEVSEVAATEELAADVLEAEVSQTGLGGSDGDDEEAAEGEVEEIEVAAARFAVLDAAEAPAPQQRVSALTSAIVNISLVGVGVSSSEPIESPDPDSSAALDSWQSRARHRHGGAGSSVSVSDLIPPSALSAGRTGRRHAGESADGDVDEMPARDEHPRDEHPRDEHPRDEHPRDEHPSDEHPRADGDPEEGGESSPHHADVASAPALTYPVASAAPLSDLPTTPEGLADPDKPASPEESADPAGEAAEETPAEEAEPVPVARRGLPTSGPPPAPTPRALDWEPEEEGEPAKKDSAEKDEAPQMGLADLLAEALAAYQESRDLHTDARSSADADTVRDRPRYRDSGTRSGLALAPDLTEQNVTEQNVTDADSTDPDPMADEDPMTAEDDEPSRESTSPLLRLPDFSAEPSWIPPEVSRRSAAGD